MLKAQIVRFIFVGIINTLFGYGVYVFFLYLGFNYIISVLGATIIGVLFNFKMIGKYVFNRSEHKLMAKFFQVYAVVFLVNVSMIKFFKLLEFNDYLSGALAIIPVAVISFVLNKYYVFKR